MKPFCPNDCRFNGGVLGEQLPLFLGFCGASKRQSRHLPLPSTTSSRAQESPAPISGSLVVPSWSAMTNASISVSFSSMSPRRLGPASSHRSGEELASRSQGRQLRSNMKSKPKSSKQPEGCAPTSHWHASTAVCTACMMPGHVQPFHASRTEPTAWPLPSSP